MKKLLFIFLMCLPSLSKAEDGYRLWLRYDIIKDPRTLQQYRNSISGMWVIGFSSTIKAAREELQTGLEGLLGKKINSQTALIEGNVVAGILGTTYFSKSISLHDQLEKVGEEGYVIVTTKVNGKNIFVITGNTETGVLYGIFQFLRLLQTQQPIQHLDIESAPLIRYRLLDHWDNLNRTVERGYAGISIWDWHKLPHYLDIRYRDYARANASIGINGAVINSVNANALMLTEDWILKAAALANVFRPYGIKVYLSPRWSAPIEIGGLKTADPLDPQVQEWWKKKVDSIYSRIPDFGGFLVKANSEGQPGPQTYGRTHADGANMLANAVVPHGGIVMWRAFVYSSDGGDRFKQAWNEFKPLDGKFNSQVLIQVKNGPIDFQPREPFSPLFGSMPQTPLMMEFQLTQEYLGFATHLVYLAPLFKECLEADTYVKGKGSTVAKVVDGSLEQHNISGIAGVANIGNDRNWCGHPFAQANWYAFGRLAWDHKLSSDQIAEEWIRETFTNSKLFVDTVKKMMLDSREITVNYMTPLGLHHIMGYNHHYGPAPWFDKASRPDWNPVYYHKADSAGIGFDRTATGSNALAQYSPEVQKEYADPKTCPDEYLLWFHHVSWSWPMKSGRTLWQELCYRYFSGADAVFRLRQSWQGLESYVDKERFEQVNMFLGIQAEEAEWWRDACVLYFQTFSGMAIPRRSDMTGHTLDYYKALRFPYAPGI